MIKLVVAYGAPEDPAAFDQHYASTHIPLVDKIPMGMAMNKGLSFRMGQTHVNRWSDELLRRIEEGEIDPSFVITHTVRLEDGPEMYKVFRDKQDSCVKVVLKP